MSLLVEADDAAAARSGAGLLAGWLRDAVAARGSATVAVSGGRTPWLLFADLAAMDVPWESVTVFQVDERLAPDGSDERNLTHLRAALAGAPVHLVAMEAGSDDPEAAAGRYGALLPDRLDVVHLGLGPDGHTASLVPGDPVLDVEDRPVALTAHPYQGCRRMTLTYPALRRADRQLWVVTGAGKDAMLPRLLAADPTIPAGRLIAPDAVVVADAAAAGAASAGVPAPGEDG
jgi:6-phosphogluconolactonase